MLEAGAYDSDWPDMHMTPAQTVQAHLDLNARVLMPIHNGTFSLALHPWKAPFEEVVALSDELGITLLTPKFGERVIVGNSSVPMFRWREVP